VGLDSQLVSEYPATLMVKKTLYCNKKTLVKESEYGLGFAYWAENGFLSKESGR
jgi:arabinogalactan endo-1,4-beta-galactosidase